VLELLRGDSLGDHAFTHADLTPRPTLLRARRTIGRSASLASLAPRASSPAVCASTPFRRAQSRQPSQLGLRRLSERRPAALALPGTNAIARQVLAQVRPGSIISSHDGGVLVARPWPPIRRSSLAACTRIPVVHDPETARFRRIYRPLRAACGHGPRHSPSSASSRREPSKTPE